MISKIDKFKTDLKNDGRSMKWFFLKYIKKQTGLSYSGFANQLNGYAKLSDGVKEGINNYLNELFGYDDIKDEKIG